MVRRSFGATWWGRAWLDALEHRAQLDPNRLPRGRTYARTGRVLRVELRPGEIVATVQGRQEDPYEVIVGAREFTGAEWDRLLKTVAAKAGHAAALLDGELRPEIADDARAAGVDLLPGPGELRPWCSCPDWADPCKHAAAVCYLAADELDADPFALLYLRGLSRSEVLAELRRLRATSGGVLGSSAADPANRGLLLSHEDNKSPKFVLARTAWTRELGPLPAVPQPPAQPGRPAPWPTDPPPGVAFTARGLQSVVADAARRAWRQAQGDGHSELGLSAASDLARRAAAILARVNRESEVARGDTDAGAGAGAHAHLGTRVDAEAGWKALVRSSGRTASDLRLDAAAWAFAREAGLKMAAEPRWPAPVGEMLAAHGALLSAGFSRRDVTVDANRITVKSLGRQLRLGQDGRWYPFDKVAGRWQLAGAPADEPEELLDR